MTLKHGKYAGLDLSELIGDNTEKYSYFKWLLNNEKTPNKVRDQMRAMDTPDNWYLLDRWKRLPVALRNFWQPRNGFIGFIEHEKIKEQ